jgi:hypothetical protein
VAAAGVAAGVTVSTGSFLCLPFLALLEVASRIGVTGMTGTAGVIVEEVVRDIGRDAGRERDSSMTALGIAGAVKPGGMAGVARRGGSKNWPLNGVIGVPRTGSLSLSLTSASTFIDACSSTLKTVSSACRC